jgi:hypothetical protein
MLDIELQTTEWLKNESFTVQTALRHDISAMLRSHYQEIIDAPGRESVRQGRRDKLRELSVFPFSDYDH